MEFHRSKNRDSFLFSMDIHEIILLSESLEKMPVTSETMRLLYVLDQALFAYHRDRERHD